MLVRTAVSVAVITAALLPRALASPSVPEPTDPVARALRSLDTDVFPSGGAQAKSLKRMLAENVRGRLRAANEPENTAWRKVRTRAEWETFRDARVRALRDSLGEFPPVPGKIRVQVTRTIRGEGYRIENLVYESRPGLFVTANLYLPAGRSPTAPASAPGIAGMPGILISHSHHAPRTQGELQDMGVTWAKLGCAVLVPDHVGHGERRQHAFTREASYPEPFKPGRQDYYFRYNTALQLHLAGESLMGWMAWDLMRGVDVLLAQDGIDPKRIVLIGAVAGGGDPAGVAAALDGRVAAVVPFNFGGPQPDYGIPADAERGFYYFGVPWWESTRCLRLSARDGFAHWLIVASVAPRRLVYAHEFFWDRDRDPVWPRLVKVFGLYDAADHLAVATGRGTLRGEPPENTHCTNVGPAHRAQLYPALARWFGIEPPAKESSERRTPDELASLTPEVLAELKPRPVHELAAELSQARSRAVRERLAELNPEERRRRVREDWAKLLGDVEQKSEPKVTARREEQVAGITAERIALQTEPGITVPLLLLTPPHEAGKRLPVVVMFAQEGKQRVLRERSQAVAALLASGAAVCLCDVRGTGETGAPGDDRGRTGEAADVAQTEFMLGGTVLGARLRDLRSVLRYLRSRDALDGSRVSLWGESLALPNASDRRLDVPLDAGKLPDYAEPLGGLLAMLGVLFDEDVRAAYSHGGLTDFASCLQSPFCYIPADAVVPGAIPAGDVAAIKQAIAPRPLRLDGGVDGLNRRVKDDVDRDIPAAAWVLRQLSS